MIPSKLEEWDLSTINRLIAFKDIESEKFDFKGHGFKGLKTLSMHICAMANTLGGYIVCGIDDDNLTFKKNGFKLGSEKQVQDAINNAIVRVDLEPNVTIKLDIIEGDEFFPVIKIENLIYRKPFVVKGGCCYIRAGSQSVAASRGAIVNLFGNLIQRRNSALRLRAACKDLLEQIRYTSADVESANPRDPLSNIKPINLNFIQNAVLDTDWLFVENNLYGGHDSDYSITSGYYSFYNNMERLNLAIDTFDRAIDTFNQPLILENREKIKENHMRFWHPEGQESKQALGFVVGIIDRCNRFLTETSED